VFKRYDDLIKGYMND